MLKENTGVAEKIEKSLTLFVEAVELSSDLEVIGTALPSNEEVFVIRDYSKTEGIEGAYVEVSIEEIVRKVTDCDKAQEFVNVIQNDRASIVLNGITRTQAVRLDQTCSNKQREGFVLVDFIKELDSGTPIL